VEQVHQRSSWEENRARGHRPRVPISEGVDPIVGGPFAAEVNLEIGGVKLVHRPMLNTPSNSKELLIIDDMILWGNVAGAEVSDKTLRGGVVPGEAKKLAKSGPGTPLGDFVAVLELRIQDVGGATKHLGMGKVLAVEASATEELHGSEAVVMPRSVVIQPHSVVHGKRPETDIILVWPVHGHVHHHGPGHVLNGLCGLFSQTVLMVCDNTGNGLTLVGQKESIAKLGLCKNPIVGVVVVNGVATVGSLSFKKRLGLQGVSRTQGHLVTDKNKLRCDVEKEGAAAILLQR